MHVGLVGRGEIGYTLDLAIQLHEAGITVSLYMCEEGFLRVVGDSHRPVERLYESGVIPQDCRVRLFRTPRMRDPRSLAVFRKLSQTIRNDGIEVAHLLVGSDEIWLATLAFLLHDVPVTTTMTQPTRDIGERFPFPVIWAIQKLLAYGSDAIIVNGVDQIELLEKLYRVSANRVSFIPVSVSTSAMRLARSKVPEEPGTILFFGRAAPHKGLEYLMQAQPLITQKAPHARILVAAHGENLERCQRMIQDHNRFEIHKGYSTGDEMAAFFQRCSVVALPYLCSTSSGVLMAAYAFGKPVVATNVSGLSEYVEDGITGLLVPPADAQQLADAIIRLLSDDALRQSMGENATRRAKEKDRKIAHQTLQAYEKALAVHTHKLIRCFGSRRVTGRTPM